MKNSAKLVLAFMMLFAFFPMKTWAQEPYRQYAEDGILVNFHEIDNVDFRVFLIYNLSQDSRFTLIADEEPGLFSITSSPESGIVRLSDAFDEFYQNTQADFSLLSKMDIYHRLPQWKSCIVPSHFVSVTFDIAIRNTRSGNDHCAASDPFCTTNLYTFDAATSSTTADDIEGTTLEDGCIGMSYNPSWYYMRIHDSGKFIIHMEGLDPSTGAQRDIDYCLWGPFTDPWSPCVAGLTTAKIIDCSYSTSYSEDIFLGYQESEHDHGGSSLADGDITYHVPVTGEYYILMITNYSQQPCTITFTKTEGSGPGTTDCDILPGIANNTGPYCVGDAINLTVNYQAGATYHWTGPNGYSSNTQNPTITNCTMAMAGTYTCVTTVGGETASGSTTVVVYPQPTANFTNTTVCAGSTTQFTNTSTTNPSGQTISSYQWSFGDGTSSTVQSPSHTYSQPGTYQVTLTVSNGSGLCTDQITKTVTVNAIPTASFTATTVCQGDATQFTSTSTGDQINSYQWSFGDGQTGSGQTANHTYTQAGTFQATLTVQTSGGCSHSITQTVTVNPQPTANFTSTTVCQGETTQLSSTSTGQNISSYQWSFGDGQTGTGQNVSHTYAQAGTYQATLTVQSNGGCSDNITQTVTVNPQPTANFTATSVCQGNPTVFTSTSTGDQINGYQWNFGDGQTGTGQTISHTYAQPGTYPVTLDVQTSGSCSDAITQNVAVYAQPVASVTATPATVNYGATTTLTANAGNQGTFDFHWEPADMVVNPNSQTTQTVALQQSQTYTVTITNPQGGCTSTAQVIVSIDGSSLVAMASADKTDLCDGESTTIHAIPSGGDIDHYTFSWSPAGTLNNASSQNPVATPGLGNTTYTCHVSDGFTDIDVNVTLHVHPNVEHDIYQTICENDTYSYFGQDIHTPGVYDHTLHTQYGCDSILHPHLDNWQIYETPITDHYCQNDIYPFYGQNISEAGIYYHTLNSIHGCDSTIKLNLIQDPVYEFEMWESTCQGGPGYNYNGQFLQPSSQPYVYSLHTVSQCDSTIIIHIEESAYNSKVYNVSLCGTEYTWPSNGITYYETGVYRDTLHYDNTCDSTIVLNLELRPNYYDDVVASSCDDYRWKNDDYYVDMTFTESTVYTHHYTNAYGCESTATLYLTIHDHDEVVLPLEEACDQYFWDPMGHEITYTDHSGDYYTLSGTYHRTYKNQGECDSLVTMSVKMEYTPHPTPIYPMDLNNTAPHWVVTASEFQINTYDFNLWDTNPNCYWDSVTWTSVGAPNWIIEPFGDHNKCCKVYVLDYITDTIWLTARAFNRCAPEDGVTQKYWLVCSFYGLDDHADSQADFSVIPNPNNGQMTLNFDRFSGKVAVKVYDMRGTLIDKFQTNNNDGSFTLPYNVKGLADGIYLFVATSKEGTIAKKVVIQR